MFLIPTPSSRHGNPAAALGAGGKKRRAPHGMLRNLQRYPWVYLMAIPVFLYYVVFKYIPMGGVIIAFQRYNPFLGFSGSRWVGLQHFTDFFRSPYFFRLIRNTVFINFYQLVFGFPVPILLALLINEVRHEGYKRCIQTFTYLPHFISLVVICGIIIDFSGNRGLFNDMLAFFGMERMNILGDNRVYRTLYVGSGIWQGMGWGSIIYLATLSGVDPNLYEAAVIDGAGRFRQAVHITLPALTPIIIIQLIMRVGRIMSEGADKTILLYSPLVYDTADIISSYVYRKGLQEADFSFGMAVSLFNSGINLLLLFSANWFSRTFLQESLW